MPRKFIYPLFLLLSLVPIYFSYEHAFFWDTIQLASKHAHWFYDFSFQRFWLPEEMDSGHFPLFGMYIALCWLLFGKTLLVSHIVMAPFLLGNMFFMLKIGDFFLGKGKGMYFALLLFLDPVFSSQSTLVSPDIAVMCMCLIGIWAILETRLYLLGMACLCLAMLSMRGMMVVVALFLFLLCHDYILKRLSFKEGLKTSMVKLTKRVLFFVPSGLFSLTFLILHFLEKGWIGYHSASPWAASFDKVTAKGFLYNMGILAWRILDFGRVFIVLLLVYVVYRLMKEKNLDARKVQRIWIIVALLGSVFICLTPSLLIHKGLLLHRYLLPLFFGISLLFVYLIAPYPAKLRNSFYTIAIVGLVTGNLWIYPKQVSQGWDATLAHLPYYELRNEMLDFIEKSPYASMEIGSAFPNIERFEYTDLKSRTIRLATADLDRQDLILFSNVFNDFSDSELAALDQHWERLKEVEKRGVFFVLYKRIDKK